MDIFSWVLAAFAVTAFIVWMFMRSSIWIAIAATLVLFFLTSLGWLWWWIPIVAAGITLIGILIALIGSAVFGRAVMTVVAIVGLLVGLGASGIQWGWFTTSPTSAPGGIESIAFDPETNFLPAEAKCDTNLFVDHSVRTVEPGNPEEKQFPTAVSIPFTGDNDAAVMTEMTKTELCGNPTALEMVVNDMLLWSDDQIPGAEANKGWLNQIKADIDGNPLGINSFVDESPTGVLIVTEPYQKYAAWVNTVLLRSVPEGKQSLTSIRNWEISAAFDPSKGLPSAQQATVQENKPAWVRSYIDKMGNCLLRFGFNAEDRRMEIFECEQPAPPHEAEPAAPTTSTPPETPQDVCIQPAKPGNEYYWDAAACKWLVDSKDGGDSVGTPEHVDQQGAGEYQPTTSPGEGVSGTIGTGGKHDGTNGTGTGDHGAELPVQGATPVPTPSPSATTPPNESSNSGGTNTGTVGR